jgi:hypothetical protein
MNSALPVTGLLLLAAGFPPLAAQPLPILDSLAIVVTGASREFAYTNTQTAVLYGETSGPNRNGWQGFSVLGRECLDDYALFVDGAELRRSSATRVTVYPDHLVREYPGGIVEQVRPADSLAAFSIILTAQRPVTLTVAPLVTDGRAPDFRLELQDTLLGLARLRDLAPAAGGTLPVWLALYAEGARTTADTLLRGKQFAPGSMRLARSRTHIIGCAAGNRPADAARAAHAVAADPATFFRTRRSRMARLLQDTEVVTEDARFNRALAWAKLSLDALMMNQGTKGIFAGLPWFNNYWGRDTFIALPGAALVTGRFREALAILRSFMAFQNTDPASREYGRIPNIVSTTDTAYNTVDGTPRFVITAVDYVLRSGDTAFVREVYPVVRRATDAALDRHVDTLGFLGHEDAETWMDAVGPEGPWSPRGDRANDIQALWAGQLEAAAWLADRMGDTGRAARWRAALALLRSTFEPRYRTSFGLADRLLPDGTPDHRIRPNQVFALPLVSEETRRSVVSTVVRELTYEHGVASLAQTDENFHPWHQHDISYPKDAAYHNGTVWTWLQGPVIRTLCSYGEEELAFRITENSVAQILDHDAAGTQSELLDALPRPGAVRPRASGTFSQAWNLAEFIRNFYDDYLGARLERATHTLTLAPRLPRALGRVRAVLNLDGRGVPVEIRPGPEGTSIRMDGRELRVGGTALFSIPGGEDSRTLLRVAVPPRSHLLVEGPAAAPRVRVNRQPVPVAVSTEPAARLKERLSLAVPRSPEGLRTLRGPDHPLLPHALVARTPASGAVTLADMPDPEGDDRGVSADGSPAGSYEYPRTAHLRPGSLDLTRFTLTADSASVRFVLRFRALSDPGWHPEYGFQITYAAIALDRDGTAGTGRSDVAWNSSYRLPGGRGFERLVLVGGGVRIEDDAGRTLAAYVPLADDPPPRLGDATSGTIAFTLPKELIGSPSAGWVITVLAGAQDDHGGAGIGEFRLVLPGEAGEWQGGGKIRDVDPNIYDALEFRIP